MSNLSDSKDYYEDLPAKTRKGGKVNKMTKQTKTEPKSSRKYAKTRGEHYKDIVIAVLVTAVISFALGMHFCSNQQKQVTQAVKAAQTTAEVKK